MKKLLVFLVSLAGILILIAVLVLSRKETSAPGKIFQVKAAKVNKISRIVFKEDTTTLVLKKEQKGWMVNDQWKARIRAIKVLKKVISQMEIKSPVSEKMATGVLKDTASRHVDVIIYGNFFPLKKYEVCINPRIPGGNMMRLIRKKKWYIVNLPAGDVNPAAFFVTDPYYWRDRTLFNYLPGQVIKVTLEYGKKPLTGYTVGMDTLTNHFYFYPEDTSLKIKQADTGKIRTYLTYFQHLECDAFDRSLSPGSTDSILKQTPLYTITATDIFGKNFRMQVYPVPDRSSYAGAPAFDPDVARAWVLPLQEMILIRYYRIDPLLQDSKFFIKE